MHPLSTVLFLLGYGLAVPITARLVHIKKHRNRLALLGHQVGMLIALLGWATRGRIPMVVVHLLWMIAVKLWFDSERSSDTPTAVPKTRRR